MIFCSTGVLTQVVTDEIMKPFGRTYIPSSYVKYIESGGSRVMPIRWVESFKSKDELLKKSVLLAPMKRKELGVFRAHYAY